MNKALLLFTFFCCHLMIHAQTDVIFSSDSMVQVKDCQINQIKKGNWVVYTKDGLTDSIQATAIEREQVYLDLHSLNVMEFNAPTNQEQVWPGAYRDHNYQYYSNIASHMAGWKTGSTAIAAAGLISFAIGMEMAKDKESRNDDKASYILLGGIVFFNVGVSMNIYTSSRYRNNKEAMERIKHVSLISFGTTNEGVGLIIPLD